MKNKSYITALLGLLIITFCSPTNATEKTDVPMKLLKCFRKVIKKTYNSSDQYFPSAKLYAYMYNTLRTNDYDRALSECKSIRAHGLERYPITKVDISDFTKELLFELIKNISRPYPFYCEPARLDVQAVAILGVSGGIAALSCTMSDFRKHIYLGAEAGYGVGFGVAVSVTTQTEKFPSGNFGSFGAIYSRGYETQAGFLGNQYQGFAGAKYYDSSPNARWGIAAINDTGSLSAGLGLISGHSVGMALNIPFATSNDFSELVRLFEAFRKE